MSFWVFAIIGLLVGTLAVPLDFEDIIAFRQDLTVDSQQLILHHTNLDDEETRLRQSRLLACPILRIIVFYNMGCHMIDKERAQDLLAWSEREGKGFEELWLGSLCLSDTIIEQRKMAQNMWPPRKIPLLVFGMSFQELNQLTAEEILKEALQQPHHWYWIDWVSEIEWSKIDNFDYWRIIGAAIHLVKVQPSLANYLFRSLFNISGHSPQEIAEEIFIKFISILPLMLRKRPLLETRTVFDCIDGLLEGLDQLRADDWCKKILTVLEALSLGQFDKEKFLNALLKGKLLSTAYWLQYFDKARATNNVLAIFNQILCWELTNFGRVVIIGALGDFLEALEVSLVIPIAMQAFVRIIKNKPHFASIINQHSAKWLDDDRLFSVLYYILPTGPRALEAIKRHFTTYPLRYSLQVFDPNHQAIPELYLIKIYKKWLQDGKDWPGLIAAHRETRREIQHVFEQLFTPTTGDPKLDRVYLRHTWLMAFSCIMFELYCDLPREMAPSRCFFEALMHYHSDPSMFSWERLQKKLKKLCSFPIMRDQQAIYEGILNVASEYWNALFSAIDWIDAKTLHTALSTNINGSPYTVENLERRIEDLAVGEE